MVQLIQLPPTRKQQPAAARTFLGPDGRPIGTVVAPTVPTLVGRGTGTVLLLRDPAAVRR